MSKFFFILFVIDAILTVQACGPKGNRKRFAFTKMLLMPFLWLCCAFLLPEPYVLPLLALFFGWLGDVLLLKKGSHTFFALGMLSFGAGHIFYIFTCIKALGTISPAKIVSASIFFLIYAVFLFAGRPRLTLLKGKLKTAASLYAFLLSVVGFFAALLCFSRPNLYSLLVLIGVVLFIFSDSLLSVQAFRRSNTYCGMAVIGVYAAAQACISLGLTFLNAA